MALEIIGPSPYLVEVSWRAGGVRFGLPWFSGIARCGFPQGFKSNAITRLGSVQQSKLAMDISLLVFDSYHLRNDFANVRCPHALLLFLQQGWTRCFRKTTPWIKGDYVSSDKVLDFDASMLPKRIVSLGKHVTSQLETLRNFAFEAHAEITRKTCM